MRMPFLFLLRMKIIFSINVYYKEFLLKRKLVASVVVVAKNLDDDHDDDNVYHNQCSNNIE